MCLDLLCKNGSDFRSHHLNQNGTTYFTRIILLQKMINMVRVRFTGQELNLNKPEENSKHVKSKHYSLNE